MVHHLPGMEKKKKKKKKKMMMSDHSHAHTLSHTPW
jgi:hypothetical protein